MARTPRSLNDCTTLVDVLQMRVVAHPDALAYRFLVTGEADGPTIEWSYAELDRRVRAVAAELQQAGATAGARVLLLYPPGLDFVTAFLACACAGAIAVPAYPPDLARINRTLPRLRAIASDAGASFVLTTTAILGFSHAFAPHAPELAHARWIASDACTASPDAWAPPALAGDSLAFLQYTSGSTGRPKGVMVTHASLLANERVIARAFDHGDRFHVVGWLPTFHDMGLIGNVLQPLYLGSSCTLLSPVAFLQRPVRWLEAVSRFAATTSGGPNFAYDLVARKVQRSELARLDLSRWEVAFNGAEPIQRETMERFADVFAPCGFRRTALYPCYGLAEATLFVSGVVRGTGAQALSVDPSALARGTALEVEPGAGRDLVSSGIVAEGHRIVIADPVEHRACKSGTIGEIWVAGPSVAAGYWNRPEETEQAFRARLIDGDDTPFLRTGDLGFMAGDRLIVTGRQKDLLILRGRNVYPQDIERTVEQADPVVRFGGCAVFAIEVNGEERLAVGAETELRRGSDDGGAQRVIDAIRGAIADQHGIHAHAVVLVEPRSMPKTSSGKLQRHACRAAYLAGELDVIAVSLADTGAGDLGPEDVLGDHAGPVTDPERIAEVVWRELARGLRIDRAGLERASVPASLGLDSLTALEVQTRIEQALGVRLPEAFLWQQPTAGEILDRLLAFVREPPTEAAPFATPAPPAGGEHPLASGQARLMFLERLAGGVPVYNVHAGLRLRGKLDRDLLRRALGVVITRHAALRTVFCERDGVAFQRVLEASSVDLPIVDLSDGPAAQRDERVGAAAVAIARAPFDLAAGPPMRLHLFLLGDEDHVLHVVQHHIITDGWSMALMMTDLAAAYRALIDGAQDRVLGPALQFPDFVAWEAAHTAGLDAKRERWRLRLADLPRLELPGDRIAPSVASMRGGLTPISLPRDLTARLMELGRDLGATPFHVLVALWATLLHRYTGQDDFAIGTVSANRGRAELRDVFGFVANTVVLRCDLTGAPSFLALVGRVRDRVAEALADGEVPFEHIVRAIAGKREGSGNPLFQAAFVLEHDQVGELDVGGGTWQPVTWSPDGSVEGTAKFELSLVVKHAADGVVGAIEYASDRFEPATVQRMVECFATIARAVAAGPDRPLSELSIVGAEELRQLRGWNETARPLPEDRFIDAFRRQVQRSPDAIAVIDDGTRLSYHELHVQARRMATRLADAGVGCDQLVALLMPRGAPLLSAILGVFEAGAAYLPLDPAWPPARHHSVLAQAQPAMVVTTPELAALVEAHDRVRLVDELVAPGRDAAPAPAGSQRALAYVIFTSGSTGVPKGAMVDQRGMLNHLLAKVEDLQLGSADIVAQTASQCFDISVWQFLSPLVVGGACRVYSAEDATDPARVLARTAADGVTVLEVVPSLLAMILAVARGHLARLPALRWLVLTGEALPPELAAEWLAHCPEVPIVNAYGPTECSDDVTHQLIRTASDLGQVSTPIGRPIRNTQIHVLDRYFEYLPIGVPGEIWVGGDGVGRGYLGDPARTAASFVPDPFGPPGGRLYRTGDLGRWRDDGAIEFIGRIGQQVKLRGYRIELGEIEATLRKQATVRDAAVIAIERAPGDKRLVAYIVGRGAEVPAQDLLRSLREQLPEYMVPSAVVSLPELPVTSSGKVDRRRLPMPTWDGDTAVVAPLRTRTELTVATVWKDLLGVRDVGAEDNFFERGGHSLLASQLAARLARIFGVELSVRAVFEAQTLSALAQRIDAALLGGETRRPLLMTASGRRDAIPLSSAQQRMWTFDQFGNGSLAYNEPAAAWLEGELDIPALENALGALVERHEALRTRFELVDGGPVQHVEPYMSFVLGVEDVPAQDSAEDRRAAALQLASVEARRPFDLGSAPLLRAKLLRTGEREHLLVLTAHHIVVDAWSVEVLTRELSAVYRALSRGDASPLPALSFQYADWALAEQHLLETEAVSRQLDYWKEALAALPEVCTLPVDRAAPPVPSHRGSRYAFCLSRALTDALVSLGRRESASLFMVLLAGFQALVARASGATDIVIGAPTAHRPWIETYGLVGYFANTVVLRTDLEGDPPFAEILRRARRTTLDAYAHQDVPFERLADAVRGRRSSGRGSLFTMALVLQSSSVSALELDGIDVRRADVDTGTAKFDLTLSCQQTSDGLEASFEFSDDLFDRSSIERYATELRHVLEGAVENPDERLSALPLLGASDAQAAFARHARVDAGGALLEPLSRRFEAHVRTRPDAVAVVHGAESVTYDALNRRANRLARHLRAIGARRGALIGIATGRSIDLLVSILAVLKSGGAYVPLDPTYPLDRMRLMIDDSGAELVLVDRAGREALGGAAVRLVSVVDGEAAADRSSDDLADAPTGDDLAYVIYTSGSTGRPKGVAVPQRQVMRLFAATERWFAFDEHDVWTLFHSYAFDFSVWEIWGALLHGGMLVCVPYATSRDPEAFLRLLDEQKVTVLNQTPSAFRALMRAEAAAPKRELSLRYVVFGGEALDIHALGPWFDRHGDDAPRLVNMYGITETTVHVTYRPIGIADVAAKSGSVIGQPIRDMELHILDAALRPVPTGIPGEICVGGAGLAHGYLNDPARTAERFVPHPRAEGERLYRSGDLARRLPDGDVEYLGRIDHQVKIRGFRIELREIEAALLAHGAVSEARVRIRQVGGEPLLVAYLVATEGASVPTAGELRGFVGQRLLEHMVPQAYVALAELPLTPTGKLDVDALPVPDAARPELDTGYVAPRTPLEAALADVWATVLKVERVGVGDSFFALGGDSIRAIQARALARAQNCGFSLQALMATPTIEQLAASIASGESADGEPTAARAQRFALLLPEDRARVAADVLDAYPLTSLQQAMLYHAALAGAAPLYHNVSAFRVRASLDPALLERAVADVIARHEVLRTSFDMDAAEPIQLVHRVVPVPFAVIDLRALGSEAREASLEDFFQSEIHAAFDVARAPLLRFCVHLLDSDVFQLTLTEHHAVLDGWSVAVLVSEVFRRAFAMRDARALPPLVPPAWRYVDMVSCERNAIAGPGARAYFVEALRGATPALLGRAQASGEPAAESGQVRDIALPADVSRQLVRVARDLAVPLKSLLLAAHARVMGLLAGTDDIVLGLVANGRPEDAEADALGLFITTLPVRVSLSDGTWGGLARRAFEAERAMLPHRHYPLAEVQRAVARGPLFDAVFNFIHFHVYEGVLAEKGAEVVDVRVFQRTNFAFVANFSLDVRSQAIHIAMEHDPRLLKPRDVEAIGALYEQCLATIAEAPDASFRAQSPSARHALVSRCNDTARELPRVCVHDLVIEQARRTPDAIAATFAGDSLTYRELVARASAFAEALTTAGVGPGGLVALHLERGLDMLAALLGVLLSGGAYLPVDPMYPESRVRFLLDSARPSAVLTSRDLVAGLGATGARVVVTEDVPAAPEHARARAATSAARPDDLAYVIYTSGSTGTPKGVEVPHLAVVNLLRSMQRTLAIGARDVLCAVTTLSFDIAALELLLPLCTGARVVIASRDDAADPARLHALLRSSGATFAQATPSTWKLLLQHASLRDLELTILSGGEALPLDLAAPLAADAAALWNVYGPTETTIWSSAARVDAQPSAIHLGTPLDNTQLYVLDRDLELSPLGARGELYIGGAGVARGYRGRGDLTAERFVPDPFCAMAGARMFRTGDVVRRNADGSLEFLGRTDHQLKIRGHRVEPGEIEATLRQHPRMRDAVIVGRNDGEALRLVAYCVTTDGAAISATDLHGFVASQLPAYMVPSAFVHLAELPRTPNGKLDRAALPAPSATCDGVGAGYVAPRTLDEQQLVEIFRAMLHQSAVGVEDSFFELGGDSLLAAQMVARVRRTFDIELPLRVVLDAPTVAGLVTHVARARGARLRQVGPSAGLARQSQSPRLSFAQERLWFLDALHKNAAYHMPVALALSGDLDVAGLRRAFARVIERHESLRTCFPEVDGQPTQLVAPSLDLEIPVEDLASLAPSAHSAVVEQHAAAEALAPFDLRRGPLVRARLLRLSPKDHVLLLTMHHIVSDGWSVRVLVRELTALYAERVGAACEGLPPLPLQYADYAEWQRRRAESGGLEDQLAYWRAQLRELPVLELPADHARPPVPTGRGAELTATVAAAVAEPFFTRCRRAGATPFMGVMAAFAALLSRMTGQDDIAVGTPVAQRTDEALEPLVGLFVNTVVLRTNLDDDPTFAELLERVKRTTFEALAHQEAPFDKLLDELHPSRDLSRSPLFQIMLVVDEPALGALEVAGLGARPIEIASQTAKLDLMLEAARTADGGLRLRAEYSADLFENATIDRLLSAFSVLIEDASRSPERRISELSLLSTAERARLLAEMTEMTPVVKARLVHELVLERARQAPHAIAVACGDEQITYSALCARARQIAARLLHAGVGVEVRVAVLLERSVDLVASLLGVLLAGGAYVPLDPAYPRDRLEFMLEDSAAHALISQTSLAGMLTHRPPHVLWVDEAAAHDVPYPEVLAVPASALAYVIYTSGSTGKPKGVAIEHRNVATFLAWVETAFSAEEMSRVLAATSVCFDLSIFEIFGTLAMGGTVLVVRDALALIDDAPPDVTLINTVPSAMTELVAAQRIPGSVQTVNLAGEPLRLSLVQQVQRQTDARVLNLYGPSEDTTYSTVAVMARGQQTPPTLGRPVAATRAYALDDRFQPVPRGAVAELLLGGDNLARGYLGRPSLTAERFVPDPYAPSGQRMYKTGDNVRFRDAGNIELVGRRDHQVKLRGFRIELGEIEARILEHASCAQAVAIVRSDLPGGPCIVAYVVPREPSALSAGALESFLCERLPAHMVPAVFVSLDALPLSPNGKIDRSRLPRPVATSRATEGCPLRSASEVRLASIWEALLGAASIGQQDSFFDLGGQSLLAVRLASRIRAAYGVDLPLREIFEAPRLDEMAARIDHVVDADKATRQPALVPRSADGARPLVMSYAQERMWFLQKLDPDASAYNIVLGFRIRGPLDVSALEGALVDLVRRHEILRARFPDLDGRPTIEIAPRGSAKMVVTDLTTTPPTTRDQELRRICEAATRSAFDLERGPLMRVDVVRTGPAEHVLVAGMHHIVSDAWSLGVAAHEVGATYDELASGRAPALPAPTIQYADFAAWQRDWVGHDELDAELAYWRTQLAGASPLRLPRDRAPGAAPGAAGKRPFVLAPPIVSRLTELCRREGATLFMGLFAAFGTLLSRWTQQHDIIVGTPIAGREHTALENLIGCFVNTLALRVGLTGDPTFTALLSRVRQVTLDAFSHRNAPFQAVVEAVGAGRSAESSLIQVMFTFQNIPSDRTLRLRGLDVEPLDLDVPVARRDLTVRIEEMHGELRGVFEYDSSVFDERTIAVLTDRFTTMITVAATHTEMRVSELPWQSDEERRLGEIAADRTKQHRHDKLKALLRTRPAAIRTAPRQLVEISGEFPVIARPTGEAVDLAGWIATHQALVEQHLAREGAILWRGFHLPGEAEFERLAAALSGSLMHYDEGSTPRKVVSGNVYTSTEYPAAQRIPLHCEMAYSHQWPGRLWFWSRTVAAKGGATPIGRCRTILAGLSQRTIERFRAKGVMYVRNFAEGLDVPWQVVFRTHDRDAVARYCARAGMDFEWRHGGKLRTRQIRPALAKHPRTGEEVWFNQAHLFHTSSLDPELLRSLLETLGVDELPRNACYGDGTPIEDEAIAEIHAAHEAAALEFPWQEDDLLLVDNMLVAHGRAPFEGPRRVLVTMAEPLGGDPTSGSFRSLPAPRR